MADSQFRLAVGGGKGGVGKSFLAANLGVALQQRGRKVTLVDADLGAANLHTYLGISLPKHTLKEYLDDPEMEIEEILLRSPHTEAGLISGASDILALNSPTYRQKRRLWRSFRRLPSDTLILDLAAGTRTDIIDFFFNSDGGIVVIDPISTSLENAYSFLKNAVYRRLLLTFRGQPEVETFIRDASDSRSKLNFASVLHLLEALLKIDAEAAEHAYQELQGMKPWVVLNQVRKPAEVEIAMSFKKVVRKFLNLEIEFLGHIASDPMVAQSIMKRVPLVIAYPNSAAARGLNRIAEKMLEFWSTARVEPAAAELR